LNVIDINILDLKMSGAEQNGVTTEMKFDPDDPECQRQMWRPPDIEQDMKEMDRRKRVDMIMNSQVFREELERIIESQLNEGYLPASLSALQQVTELLLPHSARNSSLTKLGHSGMPVNDIRGIDAFRYAKGEKLLRCKLAAVYRLVELYGWAEGIYNHITVMPLIIIDLYIENNYLFMYNIEGSR
jgi:adducin